jgi:hypothetical protein
MVKSDKPDPRFAKLLAGPSADAMKQYEASSSSESEEEYISESYDEEVEDIPLGDSTDKLAIMNCNWEAIGSDDLFVLIQTFLDDNAPGRKLFKLSIHKSNYGEERMRREEEFGPEIEGLPSDDEADESLMTKDELRKIEDQRSSAIRKYEQQKKLYYYAIAEFDSVNTACIIYDEMDGVCAGVCSEALELRFVPEDTPDPSSIRDPISVTTEMPEDYMPPQADVPNLTMQHTNVKCTWDEDTPERKMMLKKLSSGQIADMDLAAYLESSESEDDAADAAELRKALFGADMPNESDDDQNSDSSASSVYGDMEMKFSRDVESAGKDLVKRMEETGTVRSKNLTVWEQYQVKRKEAAKAKKLERKEKLEQQKQERISIAQAARNAAKRARIDETNSSDDERAVLPTTPSAGLDSRFDKLKTSKFALDPTHPKFKKSK